LAGRGSYRFLPPFFFPPLADFFAIAIYPPLRVGFVREEQSSYRSAAAYRHVWRCVHTPLVASSGRVRVV